MFKTRKIKAPAPAPASPIEAEALPAIPLLSAAEGTPIHTEDDAVHAAAREHAVALLASRDPLSSPDPKYKFSNEQAFAGDAIAHEMGLSHLVAEAVADVVACNGLNVGDWVDAADVADTSGAGPEPIVGVETYVQERAL